MVQINQKWDKILDLIFENSNKSFTVREISKSVKISSSSVQRYLEELRDEGLIAENNRAIITPYFKFLKTYNIINKLYNTKLLSFLEKELNPSLIIIFGSVRKGEYDKESDVDLFIETSLGKKLDLKQFEKILGHKIQLFVENDINKLNANLYNNIVNGIKLSGYLRVKNG